MNNKSVWATLVAFTSGVFTMMTIDDLNWLILLILLIALWFSILHFTKED